MKTTQREVILERAIERRNDLEAYIHRAQADGCQPEQLRVAHEELAAMRELIRELVARARPSAS